jgi:hypothetical protein
MRRRAAALARDKRPACVEIKILRQFYGAFASSSTPSTRCRFLAARPSQVGRVIAEK